MKMMNDYFQLRIPRDLKVFYDAYVEQQEHLGMQNGNDLMRSILITKAKALEEEMDANRHSKV